MSTSANPYAAPSMGHRMAADRRRKVNACGFCSYYLASIYFAVVASTFESLAGLTAGPRSWFWWFPADLMVTTGRILFMAALMSPAMAFILGFNGKRIRLAVVWFTGGVMLYVAWLDAALTMCVVFGHPWLAVRLALVVVCSLIVVVIVYRLARINFLANQSNDAATDSEPTRRSVIEETTQIQ